LASMSQVIVFSAGATRWAVDLGWVREIVAVAGITPLPNSIPALAGVINVRGEVVPVFDSLAVLTDMVGNGGSAVDRVMILGKTSAPFGLTVDAVTRILAADKAGLAARDADPGSINGCRREFIESFVSDATGRSIPVFAAGRLADLASAGSGIFPQEEMCA